MKLPILPFGFFVWAVAFGAMPAWAQTTQGASVDLALTANPDDYRTESELNSRTRGLSFGASSGPVRFEFGWPSLHKLRYKPTPNLTVDEQRRALSFELLYTRNYPVTSRLGLAWLAGGGLTSRNSRTTSVVRKISTGEFLAPQVEEFRRDHVTAVGGLDLQVAVTRRIAIITQLRIRMYPLAPGDTSCCGPQFLTAEPRIGVRWRFY